MRITLPDAFDIPARSYDTEADIPSGRTDAVDIRARSFEVEADILPCKKMESAIGWLSAETDFFENGH